MNTIVFTKDDIRVQRSINSIYGKIEASLARTHPKGFVFDYSDRIYNSLCFLSTKFLKFMSVSKFVILLLEAIVKIILSSMKKYEDSGSLDADGIPLDSEYGKQSFLLAVLRDSIKGYKQACKDDDVSL